MWRLSILPPYETKIQNFSSKLNTLKRETAENLAGTKWRERMEMLDRIVS